MLKFTFVRNPGAAFRSAAGTRSSSACWRRRRGHRDRQNRSQPRFQSVGSRARRSTGGALGNLLDRIFREPGFLRGHVVDFIQLPYWAIFNVADMAVVCSAVLIVILTLRAFRCVAGLGEHAVTNADAVPQRYEIPESLAGERADVGLSRLTGISRNKAANLISDGLVTVGGRKVSRADRLIAGGILFAVDPEPEPEPAAAEPVVQLPIVFLDDDIVVVDKPVGVAGTSEPWVVRANRDQWTAGQQEFRLPRLVLPNAKGLSIASTWVRSGLMVVARTPLRTSLEGPVQRAGGGQDVPHARPGAPDPSTGTIDAPIGRHPHHDYRFAVTNDGKPSVTHYRTLEAFQLRVAT